MKIVVLFTQQLVILLHNLRTIYGGSEVSIPRVSRHQSTSKECGTIVQASVGVIERVEGQENVLIEVVGIGGVSEVNGMIGIVGEGLRRKRERRRECSLA